MLQSAIKKSILILSLCLLTLTSYGQDVTATLDDPSYLIGLSLDDLLKVKIVSASRTEESTFEAPNSSFVITKEEIRLMGATSIPDALKICPGVIVREVTNGNYDVSLRGGNDGYPAYNYSYTNTSILVMINNRPVFSSLQGGTYWQNLPIGLAEIEKIEIVLGPSSPLYGPNAVSGVINIITTKRTEIGRFANGDFQSNYNNTISSIHIGEQFNKKFGIDLSHNYVGKTRADLNFYDSQTQKYVTLDSALNDKSIDNRNARFSDPTSSINKNSSTINIHFTPSEKTFITGAFSRNESSSLTPLTATTSLSNFTNKSHNALLSGKTNQFSFNLSHLTGTQGLTGSLVGNKYNYTNTDLYIDYNLELLDKKISIKPAINYQAAEVDDREYTTDIGQNGTFDGYGKITTNSASLKIDAKPIKPLRIIAAGRYDKFNYPNDGVFSWQGIINYKIKDNHIVRALGGTSYNGSFLVPTLTNNTNPINPFMELIILGNKDLKLLQNKSYEVGYRTQLKTTTIDIAFFIQEFTNFNHPILQTPPFNPQQQKLTFTYLTENLELSVKQQGVTISVQSTVLNSKLQVRPHVTFQQTTANDYSPYYNVKGAFDKPNYQLQGHVDTVYAQTEKFTPNVWGGMNIIYKPTKRLYIDLSGYYFDNYTLHSGTEVSLYTGQVNNQKGANIKEKITINLNTTYSVTESVAVFLNARNITNQSSPEGFGSDKLATMILGGVRLTY